MRLSDALEKVSDLHQTAITYPKPITDQVTIQTVPADLPLDALLNYLLQDSNLQFQITSNGIIIHSAPPATEHAVDTTSYMEEVTLTEQSLINPTLSPATTTEGYAFSVALKRSKITFSDSLTASVLAANPQQNLAEAIQRMPGLSVERTKGLGTNIILRGLPNNFTHVTINGIATASGSGGRELEFDMFAPEIVQGVTINKSSTSADLEGGIAGNIYIQTARPFDQQGKKWVASIEGAHNSISEAIDPALSFMTYDTKGDWGGLLSFSTSTRTNRTDSNSEVLFRPLSRWLEKQGTAEAQLQSDQAENVLLRDTGLTIKDRFDKDETARVVFINKVGDRVYLNEQQKWGATAAVQYVPSDSLSINLDALFGNYNTREDIYDAAAYSASSSSTLEQIHGFDSTTLSDYNIHVLTDVSFTNTQHELLSKEYIHDTDFQQFSLDLNWQSDFWQLNSLIGYSSAHKIGDRSNLKYTAYGPTRSRFTDTGGENIPSDNIHSFNMYQSPERYEFEYYDVIREDIEDSQLTFMLDSQHWLSLASFPELVNFQLGLRFTDTSKQHQEGDIRLYDDNTGSATQDGTSGNKGLLHNFNPVFQLVPGGEYHIRDGRELNWLQVSNQDARQMFRSEPLVIPFTEPQFYRVDETLLNLYAMFNLEFNLLSKPTKINTGIRYVDTQVTSFGYHQQQSPSGQTEYLAEPLSQVGGYQALLPSLNMTVALDDTLLLRAAASKNLIRPSLTQLAYKRTVELDEFKYHDGNPNLKPTYANQWEVGLEWYATDQAVIATSYFDKNITSIIRESITGVAEDVLKYNDNGTIDGIYDFNIYQEVNAKNAYRIQGIELITQTPLKILNSIFDGFYLNANYSRMFNQLTEHSDLNIVTTPEGLAEETFNLVLFYNNPQLDAHLSYTHKGAYVERIERNLYPVFRNSYGQLDFAIAYRLNDHIKVTLKGINITDEKTRGYTMSPEFPVINETSGRRLTLGISAGF